MWYSVRWSSGTFHKLKVYILKVQLLAGRIRIGASLLVGCDYLTFKILGIFVQKLPLLKLFFVDVGIFANFKLETLFGTTVAVEQGWPTVAHCAKFGALHV